MPELCTLIFCIWIRRTRSARPVNGLVVRFCCLLHSTSFKMCFSAKSPGANGLNYFFFTKFLISLFCNGLCLHCNLLIQSSVDYQCYLSCGRIYFESQLKCTHTNTLVTRKKKQENIYLFKGLPLAERDSCQVNASRPWHFDPQFQHYLT